MAPSPLSVIKKWNKPIKRECYVLFYCSFWKIVIDHNKKLDTFLPLYQSCRQCEHYDSESRTRTVWWSIVILSVRLLCCIINCLSDWCTVWWTMVNCHSRVLYCNEWLTVYQTYYCMVIFVYWVSVRLVCCMATSVNCLSDRLLYSCYWIIVGQTETGGNCILVYE